jgi:hypothetical protein
MGLEKSGEVEKEGATASGACRAGGGGRNGRAIGDGLFCCCTETEGGVTLPEMVRELAEKLP